MNKTLCLEFFRITESLPPAYTHPYHKQSFPKRKAPHKGVGEKITKLKRAEHDKLEKTYTSLGKRQKFKPKMPKFNFSLLEKQDDKYSRPITGENFSPKVYINMNYKIFSTKHAENKCFVFVRGKSVS